MDDLNDDRTTFSYNRRSSRRVSFAEKREVRVYEPEKRATDKEAVYEQKIYNESNSDAEISTINQKITVTHSQFLGSRRGTVQPSTLESLNLDKESEICADFFSEFLGNENNSKESKELLKTTESLFVETHNLINKQKNENIAKNIESNSKNLEFQPFCTDKENLNVPDLFKDVDNIEMNDLFLNNDLMNSSNSLDRSILNDIKNMNESERIMNAEKDKSSMKHMKSRSEKSMHENIDISFHYSKTSETINKELKVHENKTVENIQIDAQIKSKALNIPKNEKFQHQNDENIRPQNSDTHKTSCILKERNAKDNLSNMINMNNKNMQTAESNEGFSKSCEQNSGTKISQVPETSAVKRISLGDAIVDLSDMELTNVMPTSFCNQIITDNVKDQSKVLQFTSDQQNIENRFIATEIIQADAASQEKHSEGNVESKNTYETDAELTKVPKLLHQDITKFSENTYDREGSADADMEYTCIVHKSNLLNPPVAAPLNTNTTDCGKNSSIEFQQENSADGGSFIDPIISLFGNLDESLANEVFVSTNENEIFERHGGEHLSQNKSKSLLEEIDVTESTERNDYIVEKKSKSMEMTCIGNPISHEESLNENRIKEKICKDFNNLPQHNVQNCTEVEPSTSSSNMEFTVPVGKFNSKSTENCNQRTSQNFVYSKKSESCVMEEESVNFKHKTMSQSKLSINSKNLALIQKEEQPTTSKENSSSSTTIADVTTDCNRLDVDVTDSQAEHREFVTKTIKYDFVPKTDEIYEDKFDKKDKASCTSRSFTEAFQTEHADQPSHTHEEVTDFTQILTRKTEKSKFCSTQIYAKDLVTFDDFCNDLKQKCELDSSKQSISDDEDEYHDEKLESQNYGKFENKNQEKADEMKSFVDCDEKTIMNVEVPECVSEAETREVVRDKVNRVTSLIIENTMMTEMDPTVGKITMENTENFTKSMCQMIQSVALDNKSVDENEFMKEISLANVEQCYKNCENVQSFNIPPPPQSEHICSENLSVLESENSTIDDSHKPANLDKSQFIPCDLISESKPKISSSLPEKFIKSQNNNSQKVKTIESEILKETEPTVTETAEWSLKVYPGSAKNTVQSFEKSESTCKDIKATEENVQSSHISATTSSKVENLENYKTCSDFEKGSESTISNKRQLNTSINSNNEEPNSKSPKLDHAVNVDEVIKNWEKRVRERTSTSANSISTLSEKSSVNHREICEKSQMSEYLHERESLSYRQELQGVEPEIENLKKAKAVRKRKSEELIEKPSIIENKMEKDFSYLETNEVNRSKMIKYANKEINDEKLNEIVTGKRILENENKKLDSKSKESLVRKNLERVNNVSKDQNSQLESRKSTCRSESEPKIIAIDSLGRVKSNNENTEVNSEYKTPEFSKKSCFTQLEKQDNSTLLNVSPKSIALSPVSDRGTSVMAEKRHLCEDSVQEIEIMDVEKSNQDKTFKSNSNKVDFSEYYSSCIESMEFENDHEFDLVQNQCKILSTNVKNVPLNARIGGRFASFVTCRKCLELLNTEQISNFETRILPMYRLRLVQNYPNEPLLDLYMQGGDHYTVKNASWDMDESRSVSKTESREKKFAKKMFEIPLLKLLEKLKGLELCHCVSTLNKIYSKLSSFYSFYKELKKARIYPMWYEENRLIVEITSMHTWIQVTFHIDFERIKYDYSAYPYIAASLHKVNIGRINEENLEKILTSLRKKENSLIKFLKNIDDFVQNQPKIEL